MLRTLVTDRDIWSQRRNKFLPYVEYVLTCSCRGSSEGDEIIQMYILTELGSEATKWNPKTVISSYRRPYPKIPYTSTGE